MKGAFLALFFTLCLISHSHAATCYGTKMPKQKEVLWGLQNYTIFKRYLENEYGKVRSTQNFLLLSYGFFDWLTIDLKGGAGNIKQRPLDSGEIDHSFNFNGGYGFRIKAYDGEKSKIVCGFQHISVHPRKVYVEDVRNEAILDDWQVSFLVSHQFPRVNPYLGTRWSRLDYIHRVDGNRKRIMSDRTKSIGVILGFDLPVTHNAWVNLEGQLIDEEALAFSVNYRF